MQNRKLLDIVIGIPRRSSMGYYVPTKVNVDSNDTEVYIKNPFDAQEVKRAQNIGVVIYLNELKKEIERELSKRSKE